MSIYYTPGYVTVNGYIGYDWRKEVDTNELGYDNLLYFYISYKSHLVPNVSTVKHQYTGPRFKVSPKRYPILSQ